MRNAYKAYNNDDSVLELKQILLVLNYLLLVLRVAGWINSFEDVFVKTLTLC